MPILLPNTPIFTGRELTARVAFCLLAALCLLPSVEPGIALFAGVCFAMLWSHPYKTQLKTWTTYALQAGVVGLGAGTHLAEVLQAGVSGLTYTLVGILGTLALGMILGKRFGNTPILSFLISVGTAICGGSAIAATSAAIRAKPQETSISLAIVFTLNAIALLIFPPIGRSLGMSELQFGYWSALAIHDTSSVVGAAMAFGPLALQTATTLKLARALWIIPVALLAGYGFPESNASTASKRSIKIPWFILGFVLMAAAASYLPQASTWAPTVNIIARRLLVVALFLIGTSIDANTIKQAGKPAFAQGISLWLLVSLASLAVILKLVH